MKVVLLCILLFFFLSFSFLFHKSQSESNFVWKNFSVFETLRHTFEILHLILLFLVSSLRVTMNDQAKQALYRICGRDGNGDEKEVKKILDEYPYLLNGVSFE